MPPDQCNRFYRLGIEVDLKYFDNHKQQSPTANCYTKNQLLTINYQPKQQTISLYCIFGLYFFEFEGHDFITLHK